MASNEQLIIDLKLEVEGLKQAFDKIENQAQQGGRKSGEKFSSGFSSSLSSFAGNLGAIAVAKSISAITSSVSGAVQAVSQLEVYETQFKVLLGSAAAAQKQIKELTDFAANTPFQLGDLATASSQLIAFGIEQDQIKTKLQEIGDVAAGSGSDIRELSTIFGQVSVAGKLTGERLNQLQEKAVPIGPAIARTLGVAESAVRDLVSQGKVSFNAFERAFSSLSSDGGMFNKGAENLSKTLTGLTSTFKDNVFALNAEIGNAFGPILKEIVKQSITAVQNLTKIVRENSVSIAEGFLSVAEAINNYLVAPFELVYNTLRVVGNAISTFAAGTISVFAKIGEGALTVLNKVGVVSDESLESVRNFSEASKEVFDENFASLNDSAGKLFEGTVYGKGEEFIENLRAKMATAQEVITDATAGSKKNGLDNITQSLESMDEVLKRLSTTAKTTFKDGIGKSMSAGFSALGKALAEGTNGIEAFGKALLASFGQTIAQVGQGFILEGTARAIASYGADPSAYALIGAGGAMVTFGSFISAKSGGSGAPSASTSSGGAGAVSNTEPITTPAVDSQEEAVAGNTINLTVEGNIFDNRETGLAIVDTINEAIRSDNVTINQSFA